MGLQDGDSRLMGYRVRATGVVVLITISIYMSRPMGSHTTDQLSIPLHSSHGPTCRMRIFFSRSSWSMPTVNAKGLCWSTGRIGSRRQLARSVSWGCPGGTQRPCGDHLHPIQLRFHGKPWFRKIGRFFLCHVDMWLIGPMWPKCAFGDQKALIWKKDMPFGNPPYHGTKNADF